MRFVLLLVTSFPSLLLIYFKGAGGGMHTAMHNEPAAASLNYYCCLTICPSLHFGGSGKLRLMNIMMAETFFFYKFPKLSFFWRVFFFYNP